MRRIDQRTERADKALCGKCKSLAPPTQETRGQAGIEIDRRNLLTGLAISTAAAIEVAMVMMLMAMNPVCTMFLTSNRPRFS